VSGRLARWVLRLYPLAFRRRYGEEMRALLDQQQPTASAVLDLLRGALVAHVRPPAAAIDWVDAADRLRASASGVLICWVLFAAAGFGFYKTTEDRAFSAAGHAHPVLAVAHVAVQSLALIASAAVVLGALPLIAVALTRARHDPKLRQIVARAPLPLAVFGALTAVVVAIAHAHPGHHGSGGYGLAVAWGIAGLGCGIACALLSRAALFAVPASAIRLRLALAGAGIVAAAMLVIAVATVVYTAALMVGASRLAAMGNGPFQLLSAGASLILQAVAMLALSALAGTATLRGWRVRDRLTA
jgi:hypothetical protein